MVIEMIEEKKEEREKEPNVTITVTASSFPMNLFLEWDRECKEKFGHCRWMKIWHDHLSSKQLDIFAMLLNQIEELKIRFDKLEKKPIEPEEIKTLGRKG